jgi:hypothetical protein
MDPTGNNRREVMHIVLYNIYQEAASKSKCACVYLRLLYNKHRNSYRAIGGGPRRTL